MLGVPLNVLVLGVKRDLVSLERASNVKNVFVWSSICLVNADSHLAL